MTCKYSMFKQRELDNLASDKNSCVKCKTECHKKLLLMPMQLTNLKASFKECLESKVTTYDEELDGIILSFRNVKVFTIAEDDPGNSGIPVNYIADVYVFKPKIGSVLTGAISKKSHNQIGCLVHKLFNVTIPRPDDVDDETWEGDRLNIGDEVTFQVNHVDLRGQLPYIRGSL